MSDTRSGVTADHAIGDLGEGLVFLLGLPRSGTTLLSVMLDRHPAIASPPEPWVMLALHELGRVDVRHPANSQVLGSAVERFAPPAARIMAARAAGRVLYNEHLAAAGKRILVDKTPRYHLIPEFLIDVFPAARFLWLRRDPLDIAASFRTTWNYDLPHLLAEGSDLPELFDLPIGLERLESFHDRHPEAVLAHNYEDLAADPAGGLAAVLRHIGVAANDERIADMTRFGDLERGPAAFGDPKILATTAPHTRSIGAWREVFDRDELAILLDAVGAERLARLGAAATRDALTAMGVTGGGPDATARIRARASARLEARLADIARVTTHTRPIPPEAQARIHAALHPGGDGDDAAAARDVAHLRDEVAALEGRIAALQASTSWRLTAPLRRLARLFGRG